MEQSILTSTKKILGIAEDYTVFDLDIITHINSAFSTLTQLGVGPTNGFMIEDASEVWSDFIDELDYQYNAVKSYVFLKVRQLFDPPQTSYLISAMEKQIEELEWRLNVHREETDWVDPNPPDYYIEDIQEGTIVEVSGGQRKFVGGAPT
jgi:hypothetical protein